MDRRERAQAYRDKLNVAQGGWGGRTEKYEGYTLVISSDGSVEVLDGAFHKGIFDTRQEAKDEIARLIEKKNK